MAICTPFDPTGPYVSGLLSYIDCQSVAVAQEGYRALGASTAFALRWTVYWSSRWRWRGIAW